MTGIIGNARTQPAVTARAAIVILARTILPLLTGLEAWKGVIAKPPEKSGFARSTHEVEAMNSEPNRDRKKANSGGRFVTLRIIDRTGRISTIMAPFTNIAQAISQPLRRHSNQAKAFPGEASGLRLTNRASKK